MRFATSIALALLALIPASAFAVTVYSTTLPGAARTPGNLNTMWLTDVQLHNPTSQTANVTIVYEPASGSPLQKTLPLAARASRVINDVVTFLGGSGTGNLRVESDQYLVVGQRTYNNAPGGTFGQYIGPDLPSKGPVWFTAMRGGSFRTNLGVVNETNAQNNITIRVPHSASKNEVYAANESKQYGRIEAWPGFAAAATSGNIEATADFIAYSSVVENTTGDPTYFPGLPLLDEGVIAGIAHSPGDKNTVWRSDVYFFAPSGANLTATFVRTGQNGALVAPQISTTLAAGQTLVYEDFMSQLKLGDGAGVIWFSASSPVLGVARTYNLSPSGGSFGQSAVAVSPKDYVPTGSAGVFLFASKSASTTSGSRANLALVNPAATAQTFTAELIDAAGTSRGTYPVTVEPKSFLQVTDIVGKCGVGSIDGAVVRVTGPVDFTGYLSVIDNRSGDGSTVMPAIQQWERLTTATIGAAGGTISSTGVKVTIPAGALTSDATLSLFRSNLATSLDKYRRTDVFGIDGLPDSMEKGLSYSLDFTRPGPTVGSAFVVAERNVFSPTAAGTTRAPELISATVTKSGVSGVIPSERLSLYRPDAAEAGTNESRPAVTMWAITGYYALTSPSGKFRITYPAYDLVNGGADAMALALDQAYTAIENLGLDWTRRTRWPIAVQLAPFPAETNNRLAQEEPSRLGNNYHWININVNHLASTTDIPEMKAAASHELMHLMQYLYDPRNRVSAALGPGPWYWFDEASAVWFETLVRGSSAIPDIARANYYFLTAHGLEFPPGDAGLVQDHGYGASMFVSHLVKAKGNRFVGDIIKQKADASQTPVGALESSTTLGTGSQWLLFTKNYASGTLGGGFADSATVMSLSSGHSYRFTGGTDKGTTFNLSLQDLSAWVGRVDFAYTGWAAGTALTIKFNDGGGYAKLYLYQLKGSTLTPVGDLSGGGTNVIKNIEEWQKDSSHLLLFVANARASRPYTGATPVSIEIIAAQPSGIPPFPAGEYEFRTGVVGGCANYGMGMWLMTVGDGGSVSLKYSVGVVNVSVTGGGSVVPNPAWTKPTDPQYLWNVTWKYKYEDYGGGDNVTANGTFNGSSISGTMVKGTCQYAFSDVFVLLVRR